MGNKSIILISSTQVFDNADPILLERIVKAWVIPSELLLTNKRLCFLLFDLPINEMQIRHSIIVSIYLK